MSPGSGSEGGSGGGEGSGGESQAQPPGAPDAATPGAPGVEESIAVGRLPLAAISAEFAPFDEFVGNLADPGMLASIEATVGPESAARARAAVRTLSEVNAGLRRLSGDPEGAERATLPAPAPRDELAAGAAPAALRFVSAEFAPFEDFVDRVSSPEALATLEAALGPETVDRARAAAGALLDVSAELRLGVPAEVEALRQPVSRVSAEFAPFDAFIDALRPETVNTVEEALGAEAANRARAAARALMDVSAELRVMSAPAEPVETAMPGVETAIPGVETAMVAAPPPAAGGPRGAADALRQLHERAWSSAEDSLMAIADMNIAAWTAAKRSILAAAEISRGAFSSFVSAELPFDR